MNRLCLDRTMIAALLCAVWAAAAPARATASDTFGADEAVQTISVRIDIEAAGAALEEPIALDLGLGFPLWLHPLGRPEPTIAPFGAIPQQSSAGPKIEPGSTATFVFATSDDAGQDTLQTGRQLLAGVRVADIRRVGFASARSGPWVLGAYEILINGKPFAAGKPAAAVDAEQQDARSKLKDLDGQLAAITTEYLDLETRAKADQAAQADKDRLAALAEQAAGLAKQQEELRKRVKVNLGAAQETLEADVVALSGIMEQLSQALKPLTTPPAAETASADPTRESLARQELPKDLKEAGLPLESLQEQQKWLEGRIQGRYPWFVHEQPLPPSQAGAETAQSPINKLEVILETCTHPGASSQNYVYFRVGGHKYLLNDLYLPITAEKGPQKFSLDLRAGPLTAADLRGWAVGMLGAPLPFDQAPDRWHPQRILVSIDGQSVYDSEEVLLDRLSLAAIRLVPPAHLDKTGNLVTNAPCARETCVWESGQGLGLDLVQGGALALPPPNDPTYPHAEPGLLTEPAAEEPGAGPGLTPGYPGLPGEEMLPAGSADGGGLEGDWPGGGGGDWPADPGGDWPGGGGDWPGGGGDWPGDPGGDWPGDTGGDQNEPPPPTPPPAGDPFQLDKVWISKGWKVDEPFLIEWQATGDTGEIDHFLVALRAFRPDQSPPDGEDLVAPVELPVDQRNYLATVDSSIAVNAPYHYVRPYVTAVTKDPGQQGQPSHAVEGPAVAAFPSGTDQALQPVAKDFTFEDSSGTKGAPAPIAPSGPPAAGQRSVWFAKDVQTPLALPFGGAFPSGHVAAHLAASDAISIRHETAPLSGKYQVAMHLGFMGNTGSSDSVDAIVSYTLKPPAGSAAAALNYSAVHVKGLSTAALPKLLERAIDTADLFGAGGGGQSATLEIDILLSGGGWNDPKCPPGIFGLRLLPASGTSAPAAAVNADLAIKPSGFALVPGTVRFSPSASASTNFVTVVNNGPDDIPAETLKKVRLHAVYYFGQYGKSLGELAKPTIIDLPLKSVTETKPLEANDWQGPLPAGKSILVPTGIEKVLPTKASKHFRSFAHVCLPGGQLITDSDLTNNVLHFEPSAPNVIGTGPLDYEVVAFQGDHYQGVRASYELNPEKMRQRLVWDLSAEPDQPDMSQKIRSLMVGAQVDCVGQQGDHYSSFGLGDWELEVRGAAGGAHVASGVPKVGSLILCPKTNGGPIGVMAKCDPVYIWGFTVEKPRRMFFPMPEDKTKKSVDHDYASTNLNDCVDTIDAWRTVAEDAAGAAMGYLDLTIFEHSFTGHLCTRHFPFSVQPLNKNGWACYSFNLKQTGWDNTLYGGQPHIDDEASSVRLELRGDY